MSPSKVDERRPADATYEKWAREMMRRGFSPEEYAAREGHNWACFSMDERRYSDPKTDAWIARLGDIFFHRNGAPTIAELRERYLTPEERREAEQDEREF